MCRTVFMLEFVDLPFSDGLTLRVVAGSAGIRAIEFPPPRTATATLNPRNAVLSEAERQFRAYFAGELRRFDLPLDVVGSEFQKRVWRELETIPYGETRTYRQIAEAIGAPRAVRAVGAANGSNPLPIVIPCHRVIGSGGKLVGYGGGLPLKKRLLELEGWPALYARG
jgi:methylated-DNA-[protein]-cysteine S-methyltransferase